jgi:glycosyltransferase involved in cell wall biosynthesis
MREGIETLQDVTLFRFAHIFRSSSAGGVETYLTDLNRSLLARNRMRILQMHLVPVNAPAEIEIEKVGRGEIVWIPSVWKNSEVRRVPIMRQMWAILKKKPYVPQSRICHKLLLSTLDRYRPSFSLFHWLSEDSKIVVNYLAKKQIPYVVVHHFQNDKLKKDLFRQQISGALAISGVSNVDVPPFVSNRFTNLSDGIDTDFFHPEKAVPIDRKVEGHLILLPSRIDEGKGHLDVVRALGWLARRGLAVTLACAGRVENLHVMKKLKEAVVKEGMEGRVIFAGQLGAVDLRNWYGSSDVVVFTSYSEGLGRVLLEAQAMKRPVVAYNVGGVSEAVHQGVGGCLVTKGAVEELAEQIQDLLENPVKRHEMGEKGRTFVVERFSMESLVVRHEKFYSNMLKQLSKQQAEHG